MIYRSFSIFLIFLSFAGMEVARGQSRQPYTSTLSEQELIDARSAYIKGLGEFENGNYQLALDLLTTAYIKLPEHSGINFALADAYLQIGDLANAAYYGKQATELEPQNKWYHLKLADIYKRAGRNQATIKELELALHYHPNASDILYRLAQTYADYGEPLKSNEVYNRLLKHTGPNINVYLQKLKNFDYLGMQDSAVVQLKKISDLDPGNLSTLQLISSYYLQMDKPDEAKTILKKALEKNERDPKTLIKLADIYVKEAKWDSVGTLLTDIISDPVVDAEAKLTVAQYLLSRYRQEPSNARLKQETQHLLEQFVQHEPNFARSHALAADFYAGLQQNKKALRALARTNALMPSNDAAWRQRLQLLLAERKYDEAIKVGAKADKEVPQDPFILFFWGRAYLFEGQNAEAAEKLSRASTLPARRELKSAIYSSLGSAYVGTEEWENAFEAYEHALELNPQSHGVLNNYAYFLSLQSKKLDKAEAMVLKALKLAPGNAAYLDTAGWVYYQKGEYEKARHYIQASIDTGDASAEVLEHMGEVMAKLNQPDKARKWWLQAFRKDSTRTHLKEKVNR